jgi:hypothetical protein
MKSYPKNETIFVDIKKSSEVRNKYYTHDSYVPKKNTGYLPGPARYPGGGSLSTYRRDRQTYKPLIIGIKYKIYI